MIEIDSQTKADIELLLNVARDEIINAEGDCKRFNEVSDKYGPIAHRVYLELDLPVRTFEHYHNKSLKRVLLDPYTVINRSNSFGIQSTEISIDSLEFWLHADMIKTLIDFLALTYLKEDLYACA